MPLLASSIGLIVVLGALGAWRYKTAATKASRSFLSRAETLEKENKWSEAAELLQRYLLVQPDDVEARKRLTLAIYESASTPAQRQRAITALYQSVGQNPEDSGLRIKLAQLLRESGDFRAALKESNAAAGKGDVDFGAAREAALAKLALADQEDMSAISEIAAELLEVSRKRPADYEIAIVTASLLRGKPGIAIANVADTAAVADDLVSAAVASNKDDIRAAIAGYQYKRRVGLPSASADLEKIRATWPEDIEGVLLEAEFALAGPQPDIEKGEGVLRQAIRQAPDDSRAYLLLGQQLSSREQFAEAKDVLGKGRATFPDDLSIGLLYVDALIGANEQTAAAEEYAKLSRTAKTLALQLNSDARQVLENRLRIQQARLALAAGSSGDVIGPMQEVLTATSSEPADNRSREALLALDLMAQGLAGQGKWDLAAPYWDKLAESLAIVASRQNADSRLKTFRAAALASAANAYHRAGRPEESTRRFDELSSLTNSPSVLIRQLQSHLALQSRRQFESRQWGDFLEVLEKAKEIRPRRWEAYAAEVEYATLIGEEEKALALMEKLEADESASPEMLRYLAVAYQRQGKSERADRLVDRFNATGAAESDKLLLSASIALGRGDSLAAVEKLKEAELKAATAPLAAQIQLARIQAMARSGLAAEALAEVRKLHDPKQPNVPLLLLAYETAIAVQDLASAKELQTALGATPAAGSFDLRFLDSLLLCEHYAKLSQADRDRLSREAEALRSERPKWGPAYALAGRVDELSGKADEAAQNFKQAIELGDVRPKTFEYLINALYASGDLEEAQRYLSIAASSVDGNQQLESLIGAIAANRGDLAGLIRIAREGVNRHPQDPTKKLWLAQLLLADGEPEESLPLFQNVFKASPGNQQAWIGVVAAMIQTENEQDAREWLSVLPNNSEMTEPAKHFLAAAAHELLREPENARGQFEAGLEADADNIGMRFRLAKLLQKLDVLEACKQFEEVLKREPANVEAKRELVMTLAAVGGDAQWNRVGELLGPANNAPGASNSAADARLHAMLMSQRGSNREQRLESTSHARKLTEEKVKAAGTNAEDVDRLLLAGLYEQEAKLGGDASKLKLAKAALEPLVSVDAPTPQSLLFFVQFLLRNGNELRTSLSDSPDALAIREDFFKEAENRLNQIRKSVGNSPKPQELLQLLAIEVAVLEGGGHEQDAAEALNAFAASSLPKIEDKRLRGGALQLLGEGYYKIGEYAQAENYFREYAESDAAGIANVVQVIAAQERPLDAMKECMAMRERGRSPAEIVSLLTSLVAQFEEVRESAAVEDFVRQLLESSPDDVDLLCSAAALQVSQGDNDEATELFRQVVQLTPNNVLALNNLATLLGESDEYRNEAIQTVDKAIAIAGRRPALLDTKGTIYLNGGQFPEAVACLEEAVAGDAKDPRYYFHLAAARFRAGDQAGAQGALAQARELKLDKSLLTVGDLQLLQEMERIPAVTPVAN